MCRVWDSQLDSWGRERWLRFWFFQPISHSSSQDFSLQSLVLTWVAKIFQPLSYSVVSIFLFLPGLCSPGGNRTQSTSEAPGWGAAGGCFTGGLAKAKILNLWPRVSWILVLCPSVAGGGNIFALAFLSGMVGRRTGSIKKKDQLELLERRGVLRGKISLHAKKQELSSLSVISPIFP